MTVRVAAAAIGAAVLLSAVPSAGDEVLTFTHQGMARTTIVHRPPMSDKRPRPLVIALAGLDTSAPSAAANFQRWAGFDAVADREGFVVTYPESVKATWNYGRSINRPAPVVGGVPVDDTGFIRRLIDDFVAQGLADPKRIYAVGTSRGGLLTFTLACTMTDRIAAAAAFITGMTDHQRETCRPDHPPPIMVVAGTRDPVQAYDGWLTPWGRLLSVSETMEFWRTLHGCSGQTGMSLPHREPSDPTSVALIEWTGCRTASAVKLYRVDGGGHHMPSRAPGEPGRHGRQNGDFETAEETWAFLKKFSR